MFKLSLIIFVVLHLKVIFGDRHAISKIYSGSSVGGILFKDDKIFRVSSSTEYPYVVEIDLDETHWCGGTIIRDDIVLTAAHCFSNPTGIIVRAGHVYRQSENAPGLQKRSVKSVIQHPKYIRVEKGLRKRAYNDIGILVLNEPFEITKYVSVAQFSTYDKDDIFAYKIGTILGWGATETDSFSPILLKADLVVMTKNDCENDVKNFDDNFLCAIGKRCSGGLGGGDSGGPFVLHNDDKPENDLIIGIISFGFVKHHPFMSCKLICDEKSPSIMTNVGKYAKWIMSVLEAEKTS